MRGSRVNPHKRKFAVNDPIWTTPSPNLLGSRQGSPACLENELDTSVSIEDSKLDDLFDFQKVHVYLPISVGWNLLGLGGGEFSKRSLTIYVRSLSPFRIVSISQPRRPPTRFFPSSLTRAQSRADKYSWTVRKRIELQSTFPAVAVLSGFGLVRETLRVHLPRAGKGAETCWIQNSTTLHLLTQFAFFISVHWVGLEGRCVKEGVWELVVEFRKPFLCE